MISFPFSQRLSVFHCLHRSWWSLQYSAVVMRGGISENIYIICISCNFVISILLKLPNKETLKVFGRDNMHGQDKEKMTLSIGTLRKILFSWKMVVNCRETL